MALWKFRHYSIVKVGKGLPVSLPLFEYSGPAQSCLGAFQNQKFKVYLIRIGRYTPFRVVILDIIVKSQTPLATRFFCFHNLSGIERRVLSIGNGYRTLNKLRLLFNTPLLGI